MRLHRIFADEEAPGDLTVAESRCDQLEDFELTRRDAQLGETRVVPHERPGDGHLTYDDLRLPPLDRQPEPDAGAGKQRRKEDGVNRHGVLDDQEAVLRDLEDGEQGAAGDAEEDDLANRAASR